MRAWLKRLALALLGEYEIFRVFRLDAADAGTWERVPFDVLPLHESQLAGPDLPPVLAAARSYLGDQACGFGCFEHGRLLGVAFYWWGRRYALRESWPIESHAAKLVHIVTAPEARGRGVATALIQSSSLAMRGQGRWPLYARVWHSNTPSLRAFIRSGWRPCGWQLRLYPLRRERPWCILLCADRTLSRS